ncbi:MAG: ankyrin repeat protein [Alteromonas naphthalenivorans]|jgi:ankyrin repeat protein
MKKLTIVVLILGLVSISNVLSRQTEVQAIQASIVNDIVSGNLSSIKSRINSGNVNIVLNDNKWTPFIVAAAYGQIPIMDYLYKQNPKDCITQTTKDGGTPFMEAARNNKVKVLEWFKKYKLLKRFINKADTQFGNTALMEVAYAYPKAKDAKAWLLRNKADITLKNKASLTEQEIEESVAKLPITKKTSKKSVFTEEDRFNNFFGPGIFKDPKTKKVNNQAKMLFKSVFDGDLSVVNNANSKTKNVAGSNLLASALLSGNIANVENLMKEYNLKSDYNIHFSNLNINGGIFKNGLLFAAIASAQPKASLVWAVKKQKLKLDVSGINGPWLIGQAASGNNFETIRYLQVKGAGINVPCDQYRRTILQISVEVGLVDPVILLIKAGADINAQNASGWTSLMYASAKGHTDIVNVLLEHGANVNHVSTVKNGKRTALMIAVEYGHTDVVQALLTYSKKCKNKKTCYVDINAQDANGWTSLIKASFYGHIDIVKILLAHGADVSHVSTVKNGKQSALSIVKKYKPHLVPIIEAAIKKQAAQQAVNTIKNAVAGEVY